MQLHTLFACAGARLSPTRLLWRLESRRTWSGGTALAGATGPSIDAVNALPIDAAAFFEQLVLPPPGSGHRSAADELRARLRFLSEVGLSYLTLDRQSRTLSGGEVSV